MPDPKTLLTALRRQHREARRSTVGAARVAGESAISTAVLAVFADRLVPSSGSASQLVVGVYQADDGEPNVSPVTLWLRSAGATVALPTLTEPNPNPNPDDPNDPGRMRFRSWPDSGQLAPGRFGLLEPTSGRDLDPGELDVVITPLVAFNRTCDRVGRGAGFYDRTFGPLQSSADRPILIGVAFEHQRHPELPVQSHDVPLDAVVTELGIRWRTPTIG